MFDDVIDLIINSFNFYHGRFISEFIAILFVKIIPNILNVHIQNFAVISECLLKIFLLIITVIIINKPLVQIWGNIKGKYWGIFYLLTFFTIYSFICKYDIYLLFHTLQFNLGYILPVPFFLLFWYRIADLYINNSEISKCSIFWLVFLPLYIAQSNELFAFSTFLFLVCLLTEKILRKENIKSIIIPIITMFVVFCFVLFHKFFISVFLHYYVGLKSSNFGREFIEFFRLYFNHLFIDNIFIFLLILLSFVFIIFSKINNQLKLKTIKYFVYTYSGFLLFFMLLFFIGKSCPSYGVEMSSNDENFWVLYKPILLEWKLILFSSFIYLYVILKKSTNISSYKLRILLFLFIIYCLCIIKSEFLKFDTIVYDINMKKNQYLIEKFAYFYMNKNKVIFLPITEQSVIQDGSATHFKENQLYTKGSHKNIYEFLAYMENIYFDEQKEAKGIVFFNKEYAFKKFKEDGGVISYKELEKLDFDKISQNK